MTRSGFVAIVGPANAGKSTLLNRILGQKVSIVSRKQQSTRNRVLGIHTKDECQIVFFDTPGFIKGKAKGELTKFLVNSLKDSVADADYVMLVVDVSIAVENDNFANTLYEVLEEKQLTTPNCVVLNKIDLIDRKLVLPLIASLNQKFANSDIAFIPLSAETADGVTALVDHICEAMPEGPWYFPEDMLSDQSEEFLASEIIREAIFERLHQELPYSSAVQIIHWDEGAKKVHIKADILIEKDSQKGIVIGRQGQTLKAIGTSARYQLEKCFNVPIFLELFVKVEPGWTQSRQGMKRAGYAERV